MILQFCDWAYYTNDFGGTKLDAEMFEECSREASEFVNRCTFGRAARAELDSVKDAVCALCERLYDLRIRRVKSENTDGYSVTYADINTEDAEREMYAVVRSYLEGTGLLRRL